MAARHFFPLLREEDIGPDESKVLPTFPTLNVVRYRVGMPGDQLVSQLKDKTRVALDAPPGARKSVDMPATLLRANFGRLMVHCVPSRLLSVSLHDYVRQLHPDVTCELVTDFDTAYSFPTEGLVFVSSSVLLAYMSAWRAHAVEVDMVLYLDEVHESDFATASLRRLKNAAPGVRLYIEATATRGPGNGGSFPQPALPGSTQLYHYNRASVRHWDLYQRGTPWSLLRTDGDFLIFEDDPNEAALMCDKFSAEGLRAFRLTAKTDVESFRRTMEEVNTPSPDQGVAVLVVDYSFRSGFTFPSVTRIIDPGEVRYLAIERGRPVYYKRSAYHAELYQARNRGGRTEGRLCDYWCGEGNAQLATVLLEGVEGDLACIAQRMLGYKPDPILHASAYFSGLVPRQFEHIMCGEQALRCYKSQCEWPNANKLPPSPGTASPIDAEFPMTPRSGSLADDASVFTMDDNDKTPDQMTEEAFKRARDRSRASHVKSRPPPRLEDPPPMPQMDKDSANAFDVAFSQLSNAKTRRAVPLDFGPYYYAVGLTGESNSYPDFDQVLDDCRGISVRAFLNGLPPSVKADVIACALTTYNNSIVVGTAAQYVVSYAAGSEVIRAQVDPGGLNEWAQDVRGEFVRANGLAHTAFEFMSVARDFKFQRMKRLKDKEELAVEEMLNRLAVRMHDEEAERAYTDNLSRTPPFNPSGRYQIDIQPNGWRTRLALACLGKRPGQIDLAVSSVPNDQTVPVHSTASELAMARRSTH